jgi:hypothetical protein
VRIQNLTRRSVIAAAIGLAACQRKYAASDLAGRYELRVAGGVDSIELTSNGTYFHRYTNNAGLSDAQSGTWNLQNIEDRQSVILSNFRRLLDEKSRGSGFYILPIGVREGKTTLVTDVDLGNGYRRLSRRAGLTEAKP